MNYTTRSCGRLPYLCTVHELHDSLLYNLETHLLSQPKRIRQQVPHAEIPLDAIDINNRVRSEISQPLAAGSTGGAFGDACLRGNVDTGYCYLRYGSGSVADSGGKGGAFGAQGQAVAGYLDVDAGVNVASRDEGCADAEMRVGAVGTLRCFTGQAQQLFA